MLAVWLKTLADLRSKPWQAALICVTVAASTTLLYLGLVALNASSAPYERLHSRTNGPHLVFGLVGGVAGEQMAERIRSLPGVEGSTPLWPSVVTQLRIPGADATPSVRLLAREPGEISVGRYIVVGGRDLEPSETGTVLMEASMARYFRVGPGDTVEVAGSGGLHSVTVVGFHANPVELQYPWFDPVSLFVTPATFDSLVGHAPANIQLVMGVRLEDPAAVDRFRAQVREAAARDVGGDGAHSGDRGAGGDLAGAVQMDLDWELLRDAFRSTNATAIMFTIAFGVMAVLASALITGNIAGGAVLAQSREMGVLKATGFTSGQVLMVFGGQNLLLGVVGGALGTVAGYGVASRKLEGIAITMSVPELVRFDVGVGAAVTLMTALVVLVSALLPALRISGMRPASLLAAGYDRPTSRPSITTHLLSWLRAPSLLALGVKDVTARPARQALTVLTLVVSLAIVTATASFSGMVDRLADRLDLHGLNWDLYVELRAMPADEVTAVLLGDPSIEAFYPCVRSLVAVPGRESEFEVTAAGGDWRSFPFVLLEGRLPEGPGEIMLAPKAMERTGVKVGDVVSVEIIGRQAQLTVSGVYRCIQRLGLTGFMTLDSLQSVVPDASATTFLARLKPGASPEDAQRSILTSTDYRVTAGILNKHDIFDTLRDVASSTRLLAILMAVISALGVLNATLLTAREQVREIGIRKAVGMTPAQILFAGAAGAAWLGLLGVLIGYPLGVFLIRQMAEGMAREFGTGPLPVEVSPILSCALVMMWVGLVVVGAIPAMIWAARLRTAEALRAD